jgi:hypothetical protein
VSASGSSGARSAHATKIAAAMPITSARLVFFSVFVLPVLLEVRRAPQ